MWTFKTRYLFLCVGLLIVLAVLYLNRTHQPVFPTPHHFQPIQNRIIPPLRDQTIRLLSEEIEHKPIDVDEPSHNRGQQIDGTSQERGQHHIGDKAVVLSLDTDVGQEVNLDEQHQEYNDESGHSNKHFRSSVTSAGKKDEQGVLRDGELKRQKKFDVPHVVHDSVNRTKDGKFVKEHGSGVQNGDPKGVQDGEHQGGQDRSRGTPSFWQRVDEYCNPPNKPVTGEEGHIQSSNYQLLAVHMLIRHGDRTPLTLMNIPKLKFDINLNCDLQEASKKPSLSALADFIEATEVGSGETPGPKVAMFLQSLPIGSYYQICARGQMTPEGWMQHVLLGQHMRAAYKGALFSPKVSWHDVIVPVTIYSTFTSRTQRSAYAFMYGLLPGLRHKDGNRVQKVGFINFCYGIMCNCPSVVDLGDLKDNIHGKRQRENQVIKDVLKEMEEVFITENRNTKKRKKSQLPAVHILHDNFYAALCHNKTLPCGPNGCVTADHLSKFMSGMDAVSHELRHDDNSTHIQYGRLFMHPLLSTIAHEMENAAFKKRRRGHLTLYSGHDLTINSMIDALGLPDHKWPYYASRVNFELWADKFSQHYLRVLYNGVDHTKHLRFCRKKTNKDGLCPLQYFSSFISEDNIQYFKSSSYAEACQKDFRHQ